MTANVKMTDRRSSRHVTRNHDPVSKGDHYPQTLPDRDTGLCSTCIHAADCTLNTSTQQPILFCEEFDSRLVTAGENSVGHGKPSGSDTRDAESVDQTEGHAGLCINCFHRDTCKLPRHDGGVWYCEEYE